MVLDQVFVLRYTSNGIYGYVSGTFCVQAPFLSFPFLGWCSFPLCICTMHNWPCKQDNSLLFVVAPSFDQSIFNFLMPHGLGKRGKGWLHDVFFQRGAHQPTNMIREHTERGKWKTRDFKEGTQWAKSKPKPFLCSCGPKSRPPKRLCALRPHQSNPDSIVHLYYIFLEQRRTPFTHDVAQGERWREKTTRVRVGCELSPLPLRDVAGVLCWSYDVFFLIRKAMAEMHLSSFHSPTFPLSQESLGTNHALGESIKGVLSWCSNYTNYPIASINSKLCLHEPPGRCQCGINLDPTYRRILVDKHQSMSKCF